MSEDNPLSYLTDDLLIRAVRGRDNDLSTDQAADEIKRRLSLGHEARMTMALRPVDDITVTSVANWGAIALLTSQIGSSVVVAHPGLDYVGDPCATVICRGPWTTDIGLYFTGSDLHEALSRAVLAFTEATRD